MSRGRILALGLLLAAAVSAFAYEYLGTAGPWRQLLREAVSPGRLSGSHAFLQGACATCHTPMKGVQASSCGACHADNAALIQRQPTAFHAAIGTCAGCHLEHQAGSRMPTKMDHGQLARAGLQLASRDATVPAEHPKGGERSLNCAGCHASKDRHQGLLGSACAQCHATGQWAVGGFRHPSPRSADCAQCHKPPPSHNMMHFTMMSAVIARQPGAEVRQCYLCHQTTSWNDIKGAGVVKHH